MKINYVGIVASIIALISLGKHPMAQPAITPTPLTEQLPQPATLQC